MIDDEELTRYSKNWHKPAVSKDLAKYDDAKILRLRWFFIREVHREEILKQAAVSFKNVSNWSEAV